MMKKVLLISIITISAAALVLFFMYYIPSVCMDNSIRHSRIRDDYSPDSEIIITTPSSVPEGEVENYSSSGKNFRNPDAEREKEFTFNNKTVHLTYEDSRMNLMLRDSYLDQDGNSYTFDRNKKLVEYYDFSDSGPTGSTEISIEEAKLIAENFLKEHADVSEYTLKSQSTDDEDDVYEFIYVKMIDGYETIDVVVCDVSIWGEICYFGAYAYGLCDNITLKDFSDELYLEALDKTMKDPNEDVSKYEINETKIGIIDDKVVIIYSVSVFFPESTDTYNYDVSFALT